MNQTCVLTDNDEAKLFDARRLAARGEGPASARVRATWVRFRACSLIVPVFELPEGASAATLRPARGLAQALEA